MNLTGILLTIVGILYLLGAGFDWDWFMESYRMRFFNRILGGRPRARIFFLLFGGGMLAFGVLGLAGVIDLPN